MLAGHASRHAPELQQKENKLVNTTHSSSPVDITADRAENVPVLLRACSCGACFPAAGRDPQPHAFKNTHGGAAAGDSSATKTGSSRCDVDVPVSSFKALRQPLQRITEKPAVPLPRALSNLPAFFIAATNLRRPTLTDDGLTAQHLHFKTRAPEHQMPRMRKTSRPLEQIQHGSV